MYKCMYIVKRNKAHELQKKSWHFISTNKLQLVLKQKRCWVKIPWIHETSISHDNTGPVFFTPAACIFLEKLTVLSWTIKEATLSYIHNMKAGYWICKNPSAQSYREPDKLSPHRHVRSLKNYPLFFAKVFRVVSSLAITAYIFVSTYYIHNLIVFRWDKTSPLCSVINRIFKIAQSNTIFIK